MSDLIEVGTLEDLKPDKGLIEIKDPHFLDNLTINRVQRNLETVRDMDPDAEARRINLAEKTGLPWSLSRSREQAIKEQSELPDLRNYKTYGQNTYQYFQDLKNAAISKDDFNALFNLERAADETDPSKPNLSLGRILGRFWNDLKKSISDRASGNVAATERFDPANREDVLSYFHMLNSVEKAETYKLVSNYLGKGLSQEDAESKAMEDRLQYHREYWEKLRDLPALEGSEEYTKSSGFIEDVSGGVGGSILGIGTTAINPYLGAADVFQQLYGAKAEELKASGVDPKLAEEAAKISAAGQSPLEFAGHLINLGFLKKAFKPGSTKDFLVSLLESAAAEGFEEYLQTFPEEYANIIAANPGASNEEILQKFVDDIPKIATSEEAFYSGAIGATIGALFPTAGRVTGGTLNLLDRQIQSVRFNERLDQLSKVVETTKTKERSPERIQQFIDQIGASDSAYMTSEGVQLLFQSAPEDGQQILNQIAESPEFAQEAAVSGNDIKIDTAKFMAYLTPEQQELIKPDLKPSPSSPSLREIENTDLSEELAKDEDYYQEVLDAESTFRDELKRIRREVVKAGYSDQYADDYSKIVERFADRMGLEGQNKKDFVQKISVQRRDKVIDSDGLQYNQEGKLITNSKAFRKWFGDSKVVDDQGKPLVVFHGTPDSRFIEDTGIFKTKDEYFFEKTDTRAYFFAKDSSVADTYADDRRAFDYQNAVPKTLPVYLTLKNPMIIDAKRLSWGKRGGPKTQEEQINSAKAAGYDGIIIKNTVDNYNVDGNKTTDVYIAFNPNQIKSVNNQGTFSLVDLNIYHQRQRQSKVKRFLQNIISKSGEENESNRASVQITDEKYLVSLFEGNDLSSLVHETGHIFLNELQTLATLETASDSLRSDYDSILKWLGLSPGQKIEKEHHEKFAKGFEAYLMEGKAPTVDLIQPFQRFKNWLMSVYRSAAGLGVELNDEVRNVFNRMFTAKYEVYDSAKKNNITMPTKAELDALGVVADDRKYMDRLYKKALSDAEHNLHRARNRNRRNLVKLWRDLAERQYDEDPANRLIKFLSEGVGLSKIDLLETFGQDVVDLISKKRVPPVVTEKGMGLEEASVMGGYPNPTEMVKALINVQKKDDFVKAYIEEEDRKHDTQYQVEEFLVNTDAYSDFMEIKNKYLNRSKGLPTEQTPWRAFKSYAQSRFASMPVKDAIAHHIYLAAHSKYSNQEKSKIAQGKLGEAAQASEKARLNYEMAKQAIHNKRQVEKVVRSVRRLLNSKSVSPDNQYQMIDLAARFGLANRQTGEDLNATLERLREGIPKEDRLPLNEWADRKIEQGYEVGFPGFILNSEATRDYRNIPFSAFGQLVEAFNILKTIDRQERYYTALGKAIELKQVVDELEGQLLSSVKIKPLKRLDQNALKSFFSGLNATHTKMEFLLRKLDGGKINGTWWNYFFKPISDAESNRDDRLKVVQKKLKSKDLFGRYSGSDLEGVFHKRIFTEGMPLSMTKNQVLSVALNVGTIDNRAKLLDGYGWTEEQLNAILDNLTEQDWQFVQNVWDYVGSFKEESFAIAKEMTSRRPQEIKAEPFNTKFGEIPGGYYPLVYDSRLSFTSFLHQQATDLKGLFRKVHATANTKPGSHIERKTSAGGQKVKLDLSVISDHIFEVVHDITHRKAVINVGKLVRSRQLQNSLTSTIGIDMQSQIRDWLQDVSQEKSNPSDSFHRLLRWARVGTTTMNMGLKATTMITQFVGYTQSINELGIKQAAKGLNMFYGSGSQYTEIGNRIDFVMEKSGFMRNRLSSHDRDIRDAIKNLSPGKKFNSAVKRFSFYGVGLFQLGVDLPTWYAAYDLGIKNNSELDPVEADKKAIDYADSVVRQTQGGGGTKDLSKIQRGDEALRLFTMFYGYFNTLYNLAGQRISSVNSIKDVPALAASALWLWFVPALLSEAVSGRGPRDDEEWGEWSLPLLAMYPFQTVVGARDLSNALFSGYGYQITPAQAAPKSFLDLYRDVNKAAKEDDLRLGVESTAETLGYIMKWPMKQVIITVGNIYDYVTGEDPDFEVRDLVFRKNRR